MPGCIITRVVNDCTTSCSSQQCRESPTRSECCVVCIAGEFVVDPETGVIYTRRPLDRETLSHYTLHVRAQNDVISASGESADVTVVFIQVIDVNDHAPEVVYPLPGNEIHFRRNAIRAGLMLKQLDHNFK